MQILIEVVLNNGVRGDSHTLLLVYGSMCRLHSDVPYIDNTYIICLNVIKRLINVTFNKCNRSIYI